MVGTQVRVPGIEGFDIRKLDDYDSPGFQWPPFRSGVRNLVDLSIAPYYSITSSAREISAWGMVTPSASAVLWLIINSTAVAC